MMWTATLAVLYCSHSRMTGSLYSLDHIALSCVYCSLKLTYNVTLKVCSGRNPQIKKQLCDFKIVGDLLLRSTVKSIKKFVSDLKTSAMLYVWEFDMNRPSARCHLGRT